MSDLPTLAFDPAGDGVLVDLEQMIRSRMLIQANSGGGKSYCLRYLLEQTHGHVQHLVLDPEGEFATLRAAYPYVLAGREGDVPATPETAALLCRRLMELGASGIVDLYDLPPQDRRRYVRLFLEELMALPRDLWRPCLVVIDEAHVYSPERGTGEAESTSAVITLASQGRKRGFCLIAATQRLSKVHKDVAAELGNKLIGRTALDVDLRRAADDLGFAKDRWPDLRALSSGQFFAYGPAISDEVQLVRSGEVVTQHPQAGAVASAPPPPPEALRELLAQLADLPSQAAEEARSAEELRAEIARLQAQLREQPAPEIVVERYPVPVFHGGDLQLLDRVRGDLVAATEALPRIVADLETSFHRILAGCRETQRDAAERRAIGQLHTELGARDPDAERSLLAEFAAAEIPSPGSREDGPLVSQPLASLAELVADTVRNTRRPGRCVLPANDPPAAGHVTLRKGARRMLEALASMYPLRVTVAQLGTLSKLTPSGGAWSAYWKELVEAGYIEMQGPLVGITPDGFAALGRPVPQVAATPQERLAQFKALLDSGPRRLFEALERHAPHGLTREQLAAQVSLTATGGAFGGYLGTLRQNELVEDAHGFIRLSSRVFGAN